MSIRRVRALAGAATAALIAIGLIVALIPVETGDSYCGRVLYDTSTAGPCADPMLWRRIVSLFSIIGAAAMIAFIAAASAGPRRRPLGVLAGALLALAMLASLAAVNRFLQPTRAEWCGSVLNRHHTYDAAIEARCDHLLVPYRNTAIAAIAVAAVSLAAGVIALLRSRPRRVATVTPHD